MNRALMSACPNSIAWLELQEQDWQLRQKKELPEPVDASKLVAWRSTPEWFLRDMEYQYRKGFYHGIAEAAELILELYRRGGYARPTEIGNLLGNWCNELRKWKGRALEESPLDQVGTPTLKWVPWSEIKARALERDGGRCAQCGSTENLEAHHIEPVSEGGIPSLENILTLCWRCHHTKAVV
jgi:hypothetical protein